MHILTVIGARPQFIKAAPLSDQLRRNHHEFLVHTGQHYDQQMSQVFFDELGIPTPDINIGAGGGSHAEQTAGMLVPLEHLMQEQQPDMVLVYGDTNSTLAGALAAVKLHIPVAHVESGLRSYNMTMPEEVNRIVTDRVSALLFCPTQTAADNLAREGVSEGVVITGDIMADAVYRNRDRGGDRILRQLSLEPGAYALATIHRPHNADSPERLAAILDGFAALGQPVVFPVHPRTRKNIDRFGLQTSDNLRLIDPVGYPDLLALLGNAALCVTDSGGLQKEAYLLATPCVTVRPETEWTETVTSGWNRLAEPETLVRAAQAMLALDHSQPRPDFYGDGRAAERIVAAIEAYFSFSA